MFFTGTIIGVYNLWKTASQGNFLANEAAEAPASVPQLVAAAGDHWHKWIEQRPIQMLIASAVLISIGGIVQIFPMVFIESQVPKISSVMPYTPLELSGRDIYIREGLSLIHI